MKRISLLSLVTAAIIFSTSVFAAPSMAKFSSTTGKSIASATLTHPLTAITVINATNSGFYATVPNTPVYQYISSGFNGHITHPDAIYSTNVLIRDPYQNVVFNFNLCRLAIVTIYGYYGHYGYNIDDHLCN